MDSHVPKEACIRWGPDAPCEGAILGERTCLDMPDILLSAWLNRLRCHLGCGLGWAEGSMSYMGDHCHNLTNTTEVSVCGSDAALCQITLTTCFIQEAAFIHVDLCFTG